MLVEGMIALVLLVAALVTMAQLLGLAARQRRLSEQRRVALQEVANQAERLALAPWDAVDPGQLQSWQPSDQLLAVVEQPKCRLVVSDEHDLPTARRILLTVHWTDSTGQELPPVELTAWKFRGLSESAAENRR
jgi:hypothetical protein